ncbi:MAG: LytTR family DNA-binding domain-containing protein [Acidobacteriia bacterium]|nr:LytTR family DNA-binding domain-containing protein [Terriglobia bacterium]
MLRTIIVDDEQIARYVLREELEQIQGLVVIGEADNGRSALHIIEENSPDLVFLDLQLPDLGGFEVIHNLNQKPSPPIVVVVTAFDQYAIPALEAGAIDYVLKPVGEPRLIQAVERARRLRQNPPEIAAQLRKIEEVIEPMAKGWSRKIVGKTGDEYVLLDASEVFAFKAEGELVWIITANKKYQATHTLATLQMRLQNTSFRRIHRNALVNTDHIRKMSSMSSQRWLITLGNNLEFIVSKRQANSVRQLLSF